MSKSKNKTIIPQHEIDSLARALLPAIQKFFESDEGKKEFEQWKAERAKQQSPQLNNKDLKNKVSD